MLWRLVLRVDDENDESISLRVAARQVGFSVSRCATARVARSTIVQAKFRSWEAVGVIHDMV